MCISHINKSEILTQFPEGGVIILDKVHSTNQYVIDLIPYLQLGDAFITDNQILGRGRRGRIWIAPSGQSICISVYWKMNQLCFRVVQLSLMVSFVVAKALRDVGVSKIKIKWPNDLYVNESKIAGVLVETIMKRNSITHVVIGIGINISMYLCEHLKSKISGNWINLEDVGVSVDRNILVVILINRLRKALKIFEYYGLRAFLPYWKNFDFLYAKSVTLYIKDRILIRGVSLGINAYGGLIIDKCGKIYHCPIMDEISIFISS